MTQLVALVLAAKGTSCHLCGMTGADSADHDPPRSQLIDSGEADPDQLRYLHPAHRVPCNVARGTRPITDQLRAECVQRRQAYLAGVPTTAAASSSADRSPRWRRPDSLSGAELSAEASSGISPRFRSNRPERSRHA